LTNGNYSAICKVKYYVEDVGTKEENVVITNIDNLQDVGERLDEYYGSDLETVTINFIDCPFVILSDKAAEEVQDND
jgi:hypothetical protein